MTATCLSEWQALQAALLNSGTYKASDYDFDNNGIIRAGADDTALEIPKGKNVTLNLRGVAIDRGLDEDNPPLSDADPGNVINVCGTLTLKDSNPQRSHDDLPSGDLITGGYATGSGGGVCVLGEDAKFTMKGGKITGNTAGGSGGGVYVVGGEFTMSGGTITGNTATSDSDGSDGYGGGVYVYDDKATFTMEGGTISENNASKYGGGVFVDNGATFNLSGSPTITGNTVGDDDNNVYLLEGIMINIAGTLTEAASVGVTMEKPGVFTTGLSGNGSDKNFSSDDTTYAVGLTDEREAFLGYTA